MSDASSAAPRRVVTGLDSEGRSTVIIDGPVPRGHASSQLIWHTPAVPADNEGTADASVPFTLDLLKGPGTNFSIVDLPVGIARHMHATDTIDYIVMLKGTVVLELETGEVTLGPGDLLVDRGVVHAWRNDGPETVTLVTVTIPALPVGAGATI